MKKSVFTLLQLVLVNLAIDAQNIPSQYNTSHSLKASSEINVNVFTDSLQNSMCEMYADEAFVKKLNKDNTANYFFNEDGSVIVVESKNRRNNETRIDIFDSNLELRLSLDDTYQKNGSLRQLDDKPRVSRITYDWQSTGKQEVIEGVTTELYRGKSATNWGATDVSAWIAKEGALPDALMNRLPPVEGLQGIAIKYIKKETEQCAQRIQTVKLKNISKEKKSFMLEGWSFEDVFNSSFRNNYQTESGRFGSENEYMDEAETDEEPWQPTTTWQEELSKFKPIQSKKPEIKATSQSIAGDSIIYTSPFPSAGVSNATIQLAIPSTWQINNGYLENGLPVIWLSSRPVKDLDTKKMEEYNIWKNDQVVMIISKVEPGEELNNIDGHYEDTGESWGENGPLYQYGMRFYKNHNNRQLKIRRCLITKEAKEGIIDNYLIEGFVHASEDKGLVHQFVMRFIELNNL